MLTVYSDKHKLRDAKTELYGGKLVPPFECPVRAENILERIGEVGLGDVVGPRDFGLDPVLRVHDEAFVKFLETCWAEWLEAEVIVINELRLDFMDPRSQEILGQHMREFLGLDAETSPSQ